VTEPAQGDGDAGEAAAIGRIEAALIEMGASHAPSIDWTSQLLAAIAREAGEPGEPVRQVRRPVERPRWRSWLEVGALAAAAAVAVVLIAGRASAPGAELALDVAWQHGGPAVRGGAAHTGDVARAAATGGARYRAIWVYRGDRELPFTCPAAGQTAPADQPACARQGEQLRAELALAVAGVYTFVALSADAPLPVPRGSFDDDLAAAANVSAVVLRRQLRVE
jgi:hypothetical protein